MWTQRALRSLRRVASSIVTHVVVLGLCLIAVGTFVRYTLLTDFLTEDLSEVTTSQQYALASYIANDLEAKLRERQALLGRLATSLPLPLLQHPAELAAWLGERHALQPLFSQGLLVSLRNGQTLAIYPPDADRANFATRAADLLKAADSGKPAIGTVGLDAGGEAVLPMSAPIKDANGEIVAVLAGATALSAPNFLDLVQRSQLGENGSLLVVAPDEQGVIASGPPHTGLRKSPDRAKDGEVSAVAPVPSTGWIVVARLPAAEALATVDRVQRYIVEHGAIAALLFVLTATTGLIVCLRPLSVAARQAERMLHGESPLIPLPSGRSAEVGRLTAAFNQLLARLQGKQAEVARNAYYDTPSGLPNRLLLADRTRQAIARARRAGSRLALVVFAIEASAASEDALARLAADPATIAIARQVQTILRQTDTLARIGGDDFALLVNELPTDPRAAANAVHVVLERSRTALVDALKCIDPKRAPKVSVGIAMGSGASNDCALISLAESVAQQAKRVGGNRQIVVDADVFAEESTASDTLAIRPA